MIDAGEGERELVVGEGDVREVGVHAGEVLLGDLDVELALLPGVVLVHARTITA
jgi:hypothetical protein